MKDLMKDEVVPSSPAQRPRPKVVLSPNPHREKVVIDAEGNILSSTNPREAKIIGNINNENLL